MRIHCCKYNKQECLALVVRLMVSDAFIHDNSSARRRASYLTSSATALVNMYINYIYTYIGNHIRQNLTF